MVVVVVGFAVIEKSRPKTQKIKGMFFSFVVQTTKRAWHEKMNGGRAVAHKIPNKNVSKVQGFKNGTSKSATEN